MDSARFLDIFSYALVHIMMGLVWLYIYITLLQQTRQILLKPKIKGMLEGFTGFVMISFGLKILLESER
jgi:threonine/homoserine/homoserine lactone efflux protein